MSLVLFALTSVAVFRNKSNVLSKKACVIFLVSVVYYILRCVYSPVPSFGLADLFLVCGGAVAYYVTAVSANKGKLFEGVLVAVCLAMVLNLLMWIPAINQARDGFLNFANGKDVSGMFNHRNFYSSFMVCCLSFSLCAAVWGGYTTKVRIALYALSVLSSASILNSLARGGLLALVVVWLVVFILILNSSRRIKKGGLALSLILVLVTGLAAKMGFSYIVDKRIEVSGNTEFNVQDAQGRLTYFSIAVDQVADAPLLGSGSRSIEYKSYENWSPSLLAHTDFKFVHNEFLQSVTDYGIIGFILMVAFIGYHLAVSGIVFFTAGHSGIGGKRKAYSAITITTVTAISINALASFPLHCFPVVILVSIALALSAPIAMNKSVTARRPFLRFVPHCILSALVVLSSISIIKELGAAIPFWKQGIIVDDANWSLKKAKDARWEQALTESVESNGNFDRLNKLGLIKLEASSGSPSRELDQAIAYFERSKSLHPFDPISRLNLAKCYKHKKEYQKSFDEYKDIEKMVYKRERFFNYYSYYANTCLLWAVEKVQQGNTKKALALIEYAEKLCKKRVKLINGGYSREFLQTYGAILYLKYSILMEQKKTAEAYEAFDDYIDLGRQMHFRIVGSEVLQDHADKLLKHSKEVWLKRNPERATRVVYRAKLIYSKVKKGLNSHVNQEWLTSMQGVDYMITILKGAGYSPKPQK